MLDNAWQWLLWILISGIWQKSHAAFRADAPEGLARGRLVTFLLNAGDLGISINTWSAFGVPASVTGDRCSSQVPMAYNSKDLDHETISNGHRGIDIFGYTGVSSQGFGLQIQVRT